MWPLELDLNCSLASLGLHESDRTAVYPAPLVTGPITRHEKTFIIPHGRGDEGDHFGPQLLAWPIHSNQVLQSAFPNVKFVFPTAARRRARAFNRSMTHQWFDNFFPLSVDEQRTHEDWQLKGLRETSLFIHELLRHEISIIGAENVVLGGLSQGSAASMIAMLLWNGPPIRAMFGMCAWLPLREFVEDIADPPPSDDEGSRSAVVFQQENGVTEDSPDLRNEALQELHKELDICVSLSAPQRVFQQIPIFLGHGVLDEKVPVGLGREAAHCLRTLGATVEMKEYEGLGHWYSGRMLADIVRFLACGGEEKATKETHDA